MYQECKKILREIQAHEPRVSYVDNNFMGEKSLEIKILYNDRVSVRVEGEPELREVTA